jgi:hypothetical protein
MRILYLSVTEPVSWIWITPDLISIQLGLWISQESGITIKEAKMTHKKDGEISFYYVLDVLFGGL